MSIVESLELFRSHLASRASAPVALGRPREAASGLYIFPWRVAERPDSRNAPLTRAGEPAPLPSPRLHVLLFGTPSLASEGLARLAAARQVILEAPIVSAGASSIQVAFETLDTDALTSVFRAAELPLTPCLSCVLDATI